MPNSQTPETKATSFSAKEKDEETQYSYFGARYYMSDISVWLSVDPMADKYRSLSPFMYCAGNPVILVDPDGRNFDEWEVLLRNDGTIKVNWLSDKGGDKLQIVNFSKENSQGDHIQTAKPIALDVNKNDFRNALERNNISQGQGGKPGFNIDNAVSYLNEHAYPKYDKATCGKCAKAVRLSLEAGGINTSNRPNSAKDYGPYLTKWGFSTVNRTNYEPLKGDIRVFQNYTGGSIHGHINMYNGNQWVSDFFENGDWPGYGYRKANNFTIYRW